MTEINQVISSANRSDLSESRFEPSRASEVARGAGNRGHHNRALYRDFQRVLDKYHVVPNRSNRGATTVITGGLLATIALSLSVSSAIASPRTADPTIAAIQVSNNLIASAPYTISQTDITLLGINSAGLENPSAKSQDTSISGADSLSSSTKSASDLASSSSLEENSLVPGNAPVASGPNTEINIGEIAIPGILPTITNSSLGQANSEDGIVSDTGAGVDKPANESVTAGNTSNLNSVSSKTATAISGSEIVSTKIIQEESEIPFNTVEKKDPNLDSGVTKVVSEGKNGKAFSTYIISAGGQHKKLFARYEMPAVDKVVLVGSKPSAEQLAAAAAKAISNSGISSVNVAPIPVPSGGSVAATNQQIAFGILQSYGWGQDQFSCIVQLWNKESGWNHHSLNRSSGAYGIPQSLPGRKMASAGADWKDNPATQIRWGIGYISGRYGTPCGAWAFWRGHRWY